MRQLLRAGAKPELTDMEGKTAIDYADAAGFDDAVEQLERAMASAVRRPPPPPPLPHPNHVRASSSAGSCSLRPGSPRHAAATPPPRRATATRTRTRACT